MNCTWQEFVGKQGRQLVCVRCGLVTAPTDSPLDRVFSNCLGRRALVGLSLKYIIRSMGLERAAGCKKCNEMLSRMNRWGVEGCRAHRAEIVEHLRKAYKGTSYAELATAIAKSVTTGLAFKLNPLDPLGSLVDEAIRRAIDRAK